jgi:tetratricopeptide (TPR) repeat protein
MVANLLEIESLPVKVRNAVLERAEGNPFFLEETVRMLIERRLIERADGRWVAREAIEELEVPTTLEGLLVARIDMLSAPAQRTARVASVVGRRFEAGLLDDVVPQIHGGGGSVEPGTHVAELEAHGFIRLAAAQPALEFIFRHALIHEVVYAAILRSERRRLHRYVAHAIEAHHQGRLDEHAAALARHYAEARMPERAVHYLMLAGRQALARHARPEAHDFFDKANTQLSEMEDAPPRLRLEATLGQAQAGRSFVPGDEMIELLDSVLDATHEVDDADLVGRLEIERLREWEITGQLHLPEARKATEHLFALEEEIRDRGVLGRLKMMMGWERRAADDFSGAEAMFIEAVRHLEAADRPSEASEAADYLVDVLSTVGRFADAEEWLTRTAELAEQSGDPNAIADAQLFRGKVASDRGELEEALDLTRQGTAAAEAAGNTFCTLVGNFLVGDQELRRGRPDVALVHLDRSSELAAYCHAGPMEMLGEVWLATARAHQGDVEPSRFDGPLEQARQAKSKMAEGQVLLQRGIALSAEESHLPEALEDLGTAAGLFEQIGARPLHARALHAYGQALEATGDTQAARFQIGRAAALFDELGVRPDEKSGPGE